jgi:hypothetical protein
MMMPILLQRASDNQLYTGGWGKQCNNQLPRFSIPGWCILSDAMSLCLHTWRDAMVLQILLAMLAGMMPYACRLPNPFDGFLLEKW